MLISPLATTILNLCLTWTPLFFNILGTLNDYVFTFLNILSTLNDYVFTKYKTRVLYLWYSIRQRFVYIGSSFNAAITTLLVVPKLRDITAFVFPSRIVLTFHWLGILQIVTLLWVVCSGRHLVILIWEIHQIHKVAVQRLLANMLLIQSNFHFRVIIIIIFFRNHCTKTGLILQSCALIWFLDKN